jgi:tetratricopeptide (TPR) repeat protein
LIGEQKDKSDLRLQFNAGTAAYRATNYDAALKLFSAATLASDVKLQQSAYFNLGNTQFRMGAQAKDLDALQQTWETAIKSYQNAVALDKNDADAAFNLAFAKNAVEQIKLMRQMALQARATADQEVRRRNYHGAREIMESLVQQNIAAKPFEEFAKKLTEIDEIANPSQPQSQPQP